MNRDGRGLRTLLGAATLLVMSGALTVARADLFVVFGGGTNAFVFDYDTTSKAVSYVTSVTLTRSGGLPGSVTATTRYGFMVGDGRDGVERFVTRNRTTWTNDLFIDIAGQSAANEFYFGRAGPATYAVGAAQLKDGTIFVVEGGSDYYATGDVNNRYGTVTDVFTGTLGTLADTAYGGGAGSGAPIDVTATIEGTANRFAAAGPGVDSGVHDVMVYNADGSYRGVITGLDNDGRHGLGSFKKAKQGNLILQVNGTMWNTSTMYVNARSVAEADFNTEKFSFTFALDWGEPEDVSFVSTSHNDIDGTESGLIVIGGPTRRHDGVSPDVYGVQFYSTPDGINWAATTEDPFRLDEVPGAPPGLPVANCSIAGLYRGYALGTVVCIK